MLHTRMTCHTERLRPRAVEDCPQYVRRTSRRAAESWTTTNIPSRDVAVATVWWRRAMALVCMCGGLTLAGTMR